MNFNFFLIKKIKVSISLKEVGDIYRDDWRIPLQRDADEAHKGLPLSKLPASHLSVHYSGRLESGKKVSWCWDKGIPAPVDHIPQKEIEGEDSGDELPRREKCLVW